MILLSLVLVVLAGLLVVITSGVPGYASVNGTMLANSSVLPQPQPQGIVNVGVTPNQLAAGGPLPGNHTLALEEAKCAAKEYNPPWYPTVNPAESS